MSRIRRIAPGLGRGGLIGNTEGPEAYLRELDTLPSQFCRATGGTETVISQGGKYYRVHTFTDTDPTSLLLNFDGSNGSTTFTDDSGWGHAVTANGNAAISTTESKFGGSSLYLDGTGDWLAALPNALYDITSVEYTVEFWVNFVSASGTIVLFGLNGTGTTGSWQILFDSGTLYWQGRGLGANQTTYSWSPSTSTWYHVAVSWDGTTLRMFIDGTSVATNSVNPTFSVAQNGLNIGGASDGYSLNGYIDSLRITKGQALYTSAFTPPTTALTRVGSGSLTFTRGGSVEYLVVGGGGGGGDGEGGGGGAGGVRGGSNVIQASSLDAFVGGGGANEQSGQVSSLLAVESAGGGNGANPPSTLASSGGSGGGGAWYNATSTELLPGNGNTPSVSPSQGNDGGSASTSTAFNCGGGGGAGAVGSNATSSAAGDGGDGIQSSITGSATYYGGGGGGGTDYFRNSSATGGSGGLGGGGDGGANTPGQDGTANTGGGGGGSSNRNAGGTSGTIGGDGGSGIVIARYRITQAEYFQGLDPDAAAYIEAVEAADGQSLENGVVLAINDFVLACKADGNWDAIKASCILCGARTLAGALVPLKGTAPTNYNFVGLGTDYSRSAGLTGDGSTKYLDSNRAGDADPQDDQHIACWVSTSSSSGPSNLIGTDGVSTAGGTNLYESISPSELLGASRGTGSGNGFVISSGGTATGLKGLSRSSSASYVVRVNQANTTAAVASSTPTSRNYLVFARNDASSPPQFLSNASMAFYSIGEAVDLAALDTAVSTVISEIGAAV